MNRRGFLKRFSIGVLACSMLRDALSTTLISIKPMRESAHYEVIAGLGRMVSKQDMEDGQWHLELEPLVVER